MAIIIAFFTLVLSFFLEKGFQNKVDPLWEEVVRVVDSKESMLIDKKDSLQLIYNKLHPNSEKDAYKLVDSSISFMTSWNTFKSLANKIISEKKVIVYQSIGSGTKLKISKIGLLITGDKSRLEEIICDEGLEVSLHNEWFGIRDRKGFHPGKLLRLIQKCKDNPKEKFVLIIHDIDKIHRLSLFGSAIWSNLKTSYLVIKKIDGYDKDVSIPDNLYIISTATKGRYSKVPLSLLDYWKLSTNIPYTLKIDLNELKEYLTKDKKTVFTDEERNNLIKKIYFFAKSNQIIAKKVGEAATIGQYSRIKEMLVVKEDFSRAVQYFMLNLSNYINIKKISNKDFDAIIYSIKHNGRLKKSKPIISFSKDLIELGVFSEFTVGFLFAFISFIRLRYQSRKRKELLRNLALRVEVVERNFFNNDYEYNQTYGVLLSLKEQTKKLVTSDKITFSQAVFLTSLIDESFVSIDFINSLFVKNNQDVIKLMKEVINDDKITEAKLKYYYSVLNNIKHSISQEVYEMIERKLIRMHYKTKKNFNVKLLS